MSTILNECVKEQQIIFDFLNQQVTHFGLIAQIK